MKGYSYGFITCVYAKLSQAMLCVWIHLELIALCLQSLKSKFEMAKKEVVDLKLKLWEQDLTVRQQLSREFNEQLVEIQDKMKWD